MVDIAQEAGFRKNQKLKDALLQHKALSRQGFSERLFGLLFSGLVYPQIWEDPEVDMSAMELSGEHSIVTIGSGGCNMLAYLSRSPKKIDVVDLNPHHVALNRLKLAAFRHLPGHSDVVRHFGMDGVRTNSKSYDAFIAPNLDVATRAYWDKRSLTGRRRIEVFDRNIYKTGLLGRFIGAGHLIARLHGIDLTEMANANSVREQRQFFDDRIAPLFDKPLIRWITSRKSSLFGLGIPPQQYDEWRASPPTARSPRYCASASKSSPAISRCVTIISPGRLSCAVTRSRRKARYRPTSRPKTTAPSATVPSALRSITPASPSFWLRRQPVRSIVTSCSMRRTG